MEAKDEISGFDFGGTYNEVKINGKNLMQKIIPFLWFDNQAEDAAKFYSSVFENSKIGRITRYGK